ncbi:hypothetical protein ACFQGE_01840 [Halomicroarcula sp. GCM10025817]|uniref:hypothetical protein n=1 Tax=Haloarcula TaxID=2237 RepID=UPI0023E8D179|nr:hypothetical protein [Halomicroarcula sp. SYNS111]
MSPAGPIDARAALTLERLAVWGLAVLALVALAGLVVGPGADLRTDAPDVVEGEFDAQAGAVTLTHAGGDRLTGTATDRIAVAVTDTDRNATTTVIWANESTLPVGEGAQFVVDDPRVDSDGDGDFHDGDATVGFHLEAGDTVAVVWTGRLIGAPETRTEMLATVTLVTGTSA